MDKSSLVSDHCNLGGETENCLIESISNIELKDDAAKENDITESLENTVQSSGGAKNEEFLPKVFDESEDEESEIIEQPNFGSVDEEKLKEIEATLTDDEKQIRKEDSQKLKMEGNECFKAEQYDDASKKYTEALNLCPLIFTKDRAVLYANRGASRIKQGEKGLAIEDCSKALELDDQYMKALVRRAQLYEDTDKLEEALEDYKKIVEMDPANREAVVACMRLPDQIKDRNEKLKEEMMGKLKDLGNMILKPFGLSTENFKLQQDPNSGSYSVNFQQGGSK